MNLTYIWVLLAVGPSHNHMDGISRQYVATYGNEDSCRNMARQMQTFGVYTCQKEYLLGN